MEALIGAGPLLLQGFWVTVSVAVLALALASVLGALAAAARLGGGPVGRGAAAAYSTVVRGIPDLVTILIIYFAGQRLVNALAGAVGLEGVDVSAYAAGVLAIGFIYGAYLAETFRGAWLAVPRGQIEAGVALGLSRSRLLWRIAAPQLMRHALPGYANVWQVLVKSTAVVSVIGLSDLVGLALKVGRRERDPFTFMLAVLVAYLLITAVSGWALARAEKRLARGT
ncbi:ABC transporter permease [Rubrimonas cliftonensis]|uniref:Histidine transport system permease protein/arginine/ornithine transport system permease protein n=1 Tax=Rubrimonas cliftonensis TaxID=89524 RepID=A0A1H4BEV5_9RHOB|nr:ABC transporter permease subunit [Rubrimonas cliftonensis]SEA46332.1 histidine transport system permease protein/arginine/ornithine transport system permease protein [Rubrimonas cliftonensis]